MKLNQLANNQVVVIDDEGRRTLFSYGTAVAQYRGDRLVLAPGALDYSVTTSKYIYSFTGMDRKGILAAIKSGVITEEKL